MTNAELFAELLRRCCGGATEAFALYEQCGTVRRELVQCDEQIRGFKATCDMEVGNVKCRIAAIQRECKHPVVHHEPDPSGNSDSCRECLICRATI